MCHVLRTSCTNELHLDRGAVLMEVYGLQVAAGLQSGFTAWTLLWPCVPKLLFVD